MILLISTSPLAIKNSLSQGFAGTAATEARQALRIGRHIRLHREIIEHIEVGIQILIFLQRLQISHGRARLRLSCGPTATRGVAVLLPRSPLFIRTRLTPTTITRANDAASTGLRSQCIQPAVCFALSSRKRARSADIKIRRGLRRLPLVQQ